MEPYANVSGRSGVIGYEIGENFIKVEFVDHRVYVYDERVPGRNHVEEMKKLARSGRGLSTYISINVRKNYARRM
jgi:hypothetical protein